MTTVLDIKKWRWPLVSRRAYDEAVARALSAERFANTVIQESKDLVRRADDRAHQSLTDARELVKLADERSRASLMETRLLMKEAVEMAKLASASMFPSFPEVGAGDVSGVRENDRRAAQKQREDADRVRRG